MATLNLRLDEELDQRLAREAEIADLTRSKIARQAIDEFLMRRQRQRFREQLARAMAFDSNESVASVEEALLADNEALALAEAGSGRATGHASAKRRKR